MVLIDDVSLFVVFYALRLGGDCFFFFLAELFSFCRVLIMGTGFVQGIIGEMSLVSFLDFLLFKSIKFCRIVNLCFGVKKLCYREIMGFLLCVF